jgi:ribonuclease E
MCADFPALPLLSRFSTWHSKGCQTGTECGQDPLCIGRCKEFSMANKMLIDATHAEETRVVVVKGNRVEEFDFESADRRPLRGNIYLAKVTRVEPSLQAAFVEYGGNRHGFLAFSEIHPDYYQIPVADRQALLEEEARFEEEREREEEARRQRFEARQRDESREDANEDLSEDGDSEDHHSEEEERILTKKSVRDQADEMHDNSPGQRDLLEGSEQLDTEQPDFEHLGGDTFEDIGPHRVPSRRHYKIQEVIKRRQILLVQVVKEERGNKGAALTTYLSLAGRYCVLMPNTSRGGGISRKITNAEDRRRLKELAQDLDVPEGMGVILRTAGATRTRNEVKRDFEYLMRLWEQVRDLTMTSTAPSLVHEEGSLIKRSLRDLYGKEIDEVIVAGKESYREAHDFMRMLMPDQKGAVRFYREATPLFARHGVEAQLDAMFSHSISLRSGGYIVINPTEALVSIDVNSGRATREHNIEDTALKTNLEAAEEIARQLRLRDLAGLIVIDFIDMEEGRNDRAVEKKLKDCLKHDRARIQVGRISPFGLMEMSRQRMRTGVLESSSVPCPTCGGSGYIRSVPSVALQILRSLEETLLRHGGYNLAVRTRAEVAFYLLNQKRGHLLELEARFNVMIGIFADEAMTAVAPFALQRGEPATARTDLRRLLALSAPEETEDFVEDEFVTQEGANEQEPNGEDEEREGVRSGEEEGSSDAGRRRRRRRRRRSNRPGESSDDSLAETSAEFSSDEVAPSEQDDQEDNQGIPSRVVQVQEISEEGRGQDEPRSSSGSGGRSRSRRGRGGASRRNGAESEEVQAQERFEQETHSSSASSHVEVQNGTEQNETQESVSIAAPRSRGGRGRGRGTDRKNEREIEKDIESASHAPVPQDSREPIFLAQAHVLEPVSEDPEPVAIVLTPTDPDRPKRAGWWSRARQAITGG